MLLYETEKKGVYRRSSLSCPDTTRAQTTLSSAIKGTWAKALPALDPLIPAHTLALVCTCSYTSFYRLPWAVNADPLP